MTKRRTIPALFGAVLGLAATSAWAEQPSQQDLQKQIDALQAQVQQLKAQSGPSYTAKDVDAAVSSVVRDADRRSQLLAMDSGGVNAGYMDDKFTIRSADGVFSLSPGIQWQFRSVTNYNDKSSGSNTDNGFEAARLKFSVEGTAFTKNLWYNFVWNTERSGGSLVAEEAYIVYKFADNWAVKVGQYRERVYLETATNPNRQLTVEQSLLAQVLFSGDTYTQGVELNYDDNANIRALLGFTDGYASANTNFQDPNPNNADFGVNARICYKVMGDWKSYADQTAMGNKKDLLVIGAGIDWTQNNSLNDYRYAVDAEWEAGKLAVMAGVAGRYLDVSGGGHSWDCGFIVQAAYMIDAQWEVFGRYDYVHIDHQSLSSESAYHEVTAGVNYYLKGHSAKVTLDAGWLPNGSPGDFSNAGILSNNGDNEFYFRAQFQLLL